MTVNCRISIDNRPATNAIFQAVPRIGERVSLSVDGSPQDLRVSRVVHVPDGKLEAAAIIVEVTTNIL
ncbi:hypothetical protein [Mesorhizobium sp. B4-1-4]|uniref:hypothetical protein n=1 Tax=Mesorhizobium sp. B4-1-4 TaxID=2589888 RepID=UPI001128BAED|nr:hypothetical protein [Mesorhizobium sp. B4-1-4]UCI34250.1 hypothetical protein FJW03_12850 [Mesorhizobium sp. B4-1-4]